MATGEILRKGKYFCFTLNNYTQVEEDFLKAYDCKYIFYSHEIAPTTGTPHLQGYMQFEKEMSRTFILNIMPDRISWRNARGSAAQNKVYCSKGTDHFEKGIPAPAIRGARTDLTRLRRAVKEDQPLNEIIDTCDNLQQIRFVEKLMEYKPLSLVFKKKIVHWYYGPTGLGKTRAVYDYAIASGKSFWRSNLNGAKWFNGYYGQQIALLDDVRPGKWPYVDMLTITDGYEVRLEIKGSFCIWKPEEIFITSPTKPDETYAGQLTYGDGHIDQLTRRITDLVYFEEDMNPPPVINVDE